eukprot:Rmarinus@m.9119
MKKIFSRKDKEVPASKRSTSSGHRAPKQENGDGARLANSRPGDNTPVTAEMVMERLPSFRDVPASEKPSLFLKKLKLATWLANWADPSCQLREKEAKRNILLELVDHVNTSKNVFREDNLKDACDMISLNLFRALPPDPNDNADNFDPEEDEPLLDPAWPHISVVYEFFLRFIVSSDVDQKQARKYVDQSFILRLLDLFDSTDPREREYLKTVLHRIYGKFMTLRPFIRKSINNVFYNFIYQSERHNGIAELLEILGSIINGFALPLKEEHKTFLRRALIPLHKPKILHTYHTQLSYCVCQFVEKDPTLAPVVIEGLLKFWPQTNSHKEVLFLNEIEEVLDLTQKEQFKVVQTKLFQRIALCITSQHFQVAERALFIWNNDYVVSLIAQSRREILPIILPALQSNSQKHWNGMVNNLTFNVQRVLMEMDPDLYETVQQQSRQKQVREEQDRKDKDAKWKEVERLAQKNASS